MNEIPEKIKQDVLGTWNKLSLKQKAIIGGLFLAVSIGFIFLISWIRQPQYATLYSHLSSEDAGAIVDKLKELKIDYRITQSGTAIEVPVKKVYDARIQLAKDGLPPKSELGYELFDRSKLGMSDFMQKLSYRRALEGELMRTIQQMNEIEVARIHIVIPEPSLFEEDKKEPTASVVLKLKPGVDLQKSQIRGIAHLVAGSVEGLKPENINIIDYYGNILSENLEKESMLGLSTSQLDLKKKVDNYLAFKIQSLFDDVLGPRNSVVRVDAELDFKHLEKTSETYDPENTTVRSEEIIQESSGTANNNNEPGEMEHTTTNYEINKTVEHVIQTSGNIKRLSVAILVNGVKKKEKNEKGEMVTKFIPRNQEELDRLAEIAKNVVGFNEQRNDQITITNFIFDRGQLEEQQKELRRYERRQLIMSIIQKVLLGLAIILFLLFLRSLFKKVVQQVPDEMLEPAAEAITEIPEAPEGEEGASLAPLEEELSPEAKKIKAEAERIKEFAETQPQEASRLIRTWLEEDMEK